jgi:two-component system, cell cycle response regulator
MPRDSSPSVLHQALTRHQDRTLIQELWEHFPEHMFLIRVESPRRFVIEAVNPAQRATIGFPCLGLTLEELLGDDQARSVTDHYRDCLAQNRPIRYQETGHFRDDTGEPLHWLTLLVPLHDQAGAITHLFGISQNVTELRLARHALEDQNARLEAQVAERTTELQAANARLQELATRDELTGIANRRHLAELATHAMQRARRQRAPLTLLMLDIDDFKAVNDHRGHLVGDAMLREVATALVETLRDSDLLGRFGGDEFIALLPDTPAEDAGRLAERLHAAVAERCGCTIGLGIAAFAGQDDFASLVERADRGLLRAKRDRQARLGLGQTLPPSR